MEKKEIFDSVLDTITDQIMNSVKKHYTYSKESVW